MTKIMTRHPKIGGQKTKPSRDRFREITKSEYYAKREAFAKNARALNYDYGYIKDTLVPIHNFLGSRTGRKWDKVYSEICRSADSRSKLGARLREHVDNLVECKPRYSKSGDVFDHHGYPLSWGFYVDTKGVLRKAKLTSRKAEWKKQKKNQDSKRTIFLNSEECYHWRNGIWWWLKLKEYPYIRYTRYAIKYAGYRADIPIDEAKDVLYKKCLTRTNAEAIYGTGKYAIEKRQLNKLEIRREVRPRFLKIYDKKDYPTVSGR